MFTVQCLIQFKSFINHSVTVMSCLYSKDPSNVFFRSSPLSITLYLLSCLYSKDHSNIFHRSSPLSIALSLYFLFGYLGIASLAGLAVMVVLIPVNAVLSTRLRKYQFANMKTKDKRIRFVVRLHNQNVDLRWNDRNCMYS